MNDTQWDLLKARILAGVKTIEYQDQREEGETHFRYRGMLCAYKSILNWMRMSEMGDEYATQPRRDGTECVGSKEGVE